MKKINIAQIGTFDVANYGDLLFPVVLENKIKSDFDVDNFITFSPLGGKKPLDENTYVYPIDDLEQMHQKYKFDAIIIGGGDLIRFDKHVSPTYPSTYKSALLIWQEPILIANRYNIPVIFNCPGVPFEFDMEQTWITKELIETVDYCSVRDEESKVNLEKCGLKNVVVAPDTIIRIFDIYSKEELINNCQKLMNEKVVCKASNYLILQHNQFNINDEKYIDELNKFIDYIIDEGKYEIFLFPIGYVHEDIKFLEKLNTKSDRVHIIDAVLNTYDMLSIIASSSGFIGTSLHGLITASAYNVPIISINTPELVKVHGYLELIGKEDIEANSIDMLQNIYTNHFFKEYSNKLQITRDKVEEHFKKMFEHIKLGHKQVKKTFEIDLLNKIYEDNENKTNFINYFDKAEIFYTDNNNFTKENHININWFKEDKYFLQCTIESAKMIRIDPIEGYYIKVWDVEVTVNDSKVNFEIPKHIMIDNIYYILSLDPQIIIKLEDCQKNNEVKIKLNMSKIPYSEIESMMDFQNLHTSEILADKNKLEEELDKVKEELKSELNKSLFDRIKEKF